MSCCLREIKFTILRPISTQTDLLGEVVGAKKARRKKGNFSLKAPNWVHSLDGRDKLMDFQNSTFPLAIYGCLDAAIRKLFWLRVWNKNCDPQLIGHWYLEHVMETKVIAAMIRVDKDTETGTMAAIPAFFRRHHTDVTDPVDTILSIMTHMIMLTGENGQTPLPLHTQIHTYTCTQRLSISSIERGVKK